LKIFTPKNQIPTTKTMLPTYHNSLCAISKKEIPSTYRTERKKILSTLIAKNEKKEKNSNPILFFTVIPFVERFSINNR